MTQTPPPPPTRRNLLIGSAIAGLGLTAIAVLVVLPAEFGIDPTGFGKASGLIKIAQPDSNTSPELERGARRSGVLTLTEEAPEPEPGRTDRWTYELAPYESVEFKYTVPEGGKVAFHWQASAPLHYDMHAHPFDGGTALTESYGIADAADMKGRYVAAFTGIHGWYWQNRSFETVRLTLDASGAFTASTIFEDGGESERPLQPR